ncbi:hypothetical protein GGQ84_001381 [Desulfitispora alkaliphila]|uniref:DUF7768 domain-containing protein n=1 Tax=Desulfitispora alkaliphila TaxID=622674 RepID=UPI003D1EFC86
MENMRVFNSFVYVCSPLRGDIERNINRAIGYSRFVYAEGGIPLAPHIIFTRFLDDEDPADRKAGIEMGIQLLRKCDELWVFGEKITEGMDREVSVAKALKIPVKRFNEKCQALLLPAGDGYERA